jgi:chromosome segregation ATPase
MRCRLIRFSPLLFSAGAFAQTAPQDSQVTQTLLAEVRQLRNDLQNAAATIQRVQIVMYRLQAESSVLDRATQRFEQARAACTEAEEQRKMLTVQIEHAQTQARESQTPAEQTDVEKMISNLKSQVEMFSLQEQQCQVERADAESQLRIEQAKMSDLEGRLDKLDRVLAGLASR